MNKEDITTGSFIDILNQERKLSQSGGGELYEIIAFKVSCETRSERILNLGILLENTSALSGLLVKSFQ